MLLLNADVGMFIDLFLVWFMFIDFINLDFYDTVKY